jgi:hypothetical protein
MSGTFHDFRVYKTLDTSGESQYAAKHILTSNIIIESNFPVFVQKIHDKFGSILKKDYRARCIVSFAYFTSIYVENSRVNTQEKYTYEHCSPFSQIEQTNFWIQFQDLG